MSILSRRTVRTMPWQSGQPGAMTAGPGQTTTEPHSPAAQAPVGVLQLMWRPHIVKRALRVSAVVGTLLNLINNGEQFWIHHTFTPWRVALNFIVPFCVSAYSAARNQARRSQKD